MPEQNHQITLNEFFLASDETEVADGLIWKPILREGDFAVAPGLAGPLKRGFKVIADGESDPANYVISMSDIEAGYEAKAFEHVTIPTSHKDTVLENTGFIKGLKRDVDAKGRAVLKGGFDFRDPVVKEKAEQGTIANCSSGIYFNFERKADGAKFPVALKHVALTNTPWINDMEPFGGIAASDDEAPTPTDVQGFQFSEEKVEETVELEDVEVEWDESDSLDALRGKVEAAVRAYSESFPEFDRPYFYINDLATDKALLIEERSAQNFVVPFKHKKGEVTLADTGEWKKVEKTWVAASDDLKLAVQFRARHGLGAHYEVEAVDTESKVATLKNTKQDKSVLVPFSVDGNSIEFAEAGEWRDADSQVAPEPKPAPAETKPEVTLSDDPRAALKAAHENRERKLTSNTSGGTSMPDLNLADLDLSDEARAAVEAALAAKDDEAKTLRRSVRETEVESKIEGLGLSDQPGLAKFLRTLYLEDDGQTAAVLNLSDDESAAPQPFTATQVADKFISLLPKTAEGRLNLSDQHLAVEEGDKPAEDASGEQMSDEDAAADLARTIGLSDTIHTPAK